jgi:hypothetical protein
VSAEHAIITTLGNDQILQDLNSTNGTFVNGNKVTKYILQHGDVVGVGNYYLKYINQKATPDMDFDRTLLMPALAKQEEAKRGSYVEVPSARTVKANFPLGGVKGVEGKYSGREIEISVALMAIGEEGGQLAVINRRPHGYYITYVEGDKYPLVNGKSIGSQPCALQANDVIKVGKEKLVFFLKA